MPGTLYHTYQRYRTLQTDTIRVLPVVILMPHSGCNCRCVMCDIWKANSERKELTEKDMEGLLVSLRKLQTQQVLMSGGEAMLNPLFFQFCARIRALGIRVTVLSSGLTLKTNAAALVKHVHDVIVSLDGDEATHNRIRNIPHAFARLREGIAALRRLDPAYSVSGRSVIHKLNFRVWPRLVEAAQEAGLDRISFLPADVSSQAFNRETPWSEERQQDILPAREELEELQTITEMIIRKYNPLIRSGFIAENALKLLNISRYYQAAYGLAPYPFKKCNAPWVSAVVEADGTVRPCFFHAPAGNTREAPLEKILNSPASLYFRKNLDMQKNSTCEKCVCSLNLSPVTKLKP